MSYTFQGAKTDEKDDNNKSYGDNSDPHWIYYNLALQRKKL